MENENFELDMEYRLFDSEIMNYVKQETAPNAPSIPLSQYQQPHLPPQYQNQPQNFHFELQQNPNNINTTSPPSSSDQESSFRKKMSPSGSESHPSSSPNYYPYSPDSGLNLTLFHKTKASNGHWEPILSGTELRVTKVHGKKLKLILQTPPDIHFSEDQLKVYLVNEHENSIIPDGLKIETYSQMDAEYAEIIFKIFVLGKRLFVRTVIEGERPVSGKSVSFYAHNNSHRVELKRRKSEFEVNVHVNTNNNNTGNTGNTQNGPNSSHNSPQNFASGASSSSVRPNPSAPQDRLPKMMTFDNDVVVNGYVRAREFLQYSDLRLKTNIEDIKDAIEIVQKLEGKTYNWKDSSELSEDSPKFQQKGERVIGLIAQDVQKVLPELVRTDPETGFLSVSYIELLPILLQAFNDFVKEYRSDVGNLRSEIGLLKERLGSDADEPEEYELTDLSSSTDQGLTPEGAPANPKKPRKSKTDFVQEIEAHQEEKKTIRGWIKALIGVQVGLLFLGILAIIAGSVLLGLGYLSASDATSSSTAANLRSQSNGSDDCRRNRTRILEMPVSMEPLPPPAEYPDSNKLEEQSSDSQGGETRNRFSEYAVIRSVGERSDNQTTTTDDDDPCTSTSSPRDPIDPNTTLEIRAGWTLVGGGFFIIIINSLALALTCLFLI